MNPQRVICLFLFFLVICLTWSISCLKGIGESMSPTILQGDIIICSKVFAIKRDAIYVIRMNRTINNRKILKRCIAIPGDTIYYGANSLEVCNGDYRRRYYGSDTQIYFEDLISYRRFVIDYAELVTSLDINNLSLSVMTNHEIDFPKIIENYNVHLEETPAQMFSSNGQQRIKENSDQAYWIIKEYFFLGDNFSSSTDSRVFGTISKSKIIAKSIFIFRQDHSKWVLKPLK